LCIQKALKLFIVSLLAVFLSATAFFVPYTAAYGAPDNPPGEPDVGMPANRQIDNNGVLLDPDLINPLEGRYDFQLTPSEGSTRAYVSIPAAVLAALCIENPNFQLSFVAPFGIYMMPAAIVNGLEGLDKNELRSASFRITLSERSADEELQNIFKKALPKAKPISLLVEFKLELIDTASKEVLLNINYPIGPMEQLLSLEGAELPRYYGVYSYDESSQGFAFAPHKAVDYGDETYLSVALTGSGIYMAAEYQAAFTDVPATAWYAIPVLKAAGKLLVRGTGGDSYEPERAVTRAEFTQMIANALLLPEASGGAPYTDVSADQWYYNAITRAKALGLLDGFTEKSFYPNRPITREEMAVILAAVLRKCGFTSEAALGQFTDSVAITPAFMPDIALVFGAGLMMGVSYSKFDPKGVTTRAQAATVQIRLLEILEMIDK
jgi:hypothetical protein